MILDVFNHFNGNDDIKLIIGQWNSTVQITFVEQNILQLEILLKKVTRLYLIATVAKLPAEKAFPRTHIQDTSWRGRQ